MSIGTPRHDLNGVNPPALPWLTAKDPGDNTPMTLQYSFGTPVGGAQCGEVQFIDYHAENTTTDSSTTFPSECVSTALTAQEKVVIYSLLNMECSQRLPRHHRNFA